MALFTLSWSSGPRITRRAKNRSRRIARLALVGFTAGAFLLSVEIFLPRYLEGTAERALQTHLNSTGVQIRVESRPALRMLLGRFDAIRIDAAGVGFGELAVTRVEAVLHHVIVDVPGLLTRERSLVFSQVEAAAAWLHVSSGDLTAYMNQFLQQQTRDVKVKDITMEISAEGYLASGILEQAGVRLPLAFRGAFDLDAGAQQIHLAVDRIIVGGEPIPEPLQGDLIRMTGLDMMTINLRNAAFPLDLRLAAVESRDEGLLLLLTSDGSVR
ncbi:MAG: DUF2993 domain-containing protein [Thermaerobacterales bacterium]